MHVLRRRNMYEYEEKIKKLTELYKENKEFLKVDEENHLLLIKDKTPLDSMPLTDFVMILNSMLILLDPDEKAADLMSQHYLSLNVDDYNSCLQERVKLTEQKNIISKLKIKSGSIKNPDCVVVIPDPKYFLTKFDQIQKGLQSGKEDFEKEREIYAKQLKNAITTASKTNAKNAAKFNLDNSNTFNKDRDK